MYENIIEGVLLGAVLGISRGLKGFAKHKKDSDEPFEVKRFSISVGICVGLGVVVQFVEQYIPGAENLILQFLLQFAAPWVGTSVVEDIFSL